MFKIKYRRFYNKKGVPIIRKYLKDHHLELIAIAVMIFLVYLEHLIYDEIKAKSILKPIVVLDTMGDEDKWAPEFSDGVELFKSGVHGFRVKWEKGGWRVVEWKLRRTNFVEKERYIVLFEGKAAKKGKITLSLFDDNKQWVSLHMDVDEKMSERHYDLASIKDCWVDIKENNITVTKRKGDSDSFNWKCIEKAELERYYDEEGKNEIICKKLMILWLDYEVQ